MPYQYAFDAARLLERCVFEIQDVLRTAARNRRSGGTSLRDLEESLAATEMLLHQFFIQLLETEKIECASVPVVQELYPGSGLPSSLSNSVDLLSLVLSVKKRHVPADRSSDSQGYSLARSTTDSLLFRLIVALQLCLIRIDDAHLVIVGKRRNETSMDSSRRAINRSLALTSSVGLVTWIFLHRQRARGELIRDYSTFLRTVAKAGVAALSFRFIHISWSHLWMSTKLVKSADDIDEWNQQWRMIQSTSTSHNDLLPETETDVVVKPVHSRQSEKLVEYALRQPHKFSLLQSHGELRFLMLKRAMDIFYASVGAAMRVTKGRPEHDWQLALATAAASSFYSLTGASRQAAEITSSSGTAQELIRNAWGMVSRPAIKNLSLQATRLLKGAAVADRIEVNGVPCFVLSADPAPELASAIESFHRKHGRKAVRTLSTIDEQQEHTPPKRTSVSKPFAGSQYRQRDVLFHLTGGGFFAHIIASDLPYLLDWSAATGAVVICPEYGLLPEHTFPDALLQVCDVYHALVEGHAIPLLGFELNRIIVTGESAGGNLAAALCVKLALDEKQAYEDNMIDLFAKHPRFPWEFKDKVPFPDALLLSCPVLNMSLELSHSRVVGTDDPVLRSGLLTAISDSYVPPRLGISKKNPLASPFYASDQILRMFPPTLLIASSNDPVLDDSVVFNQRLRSLGIESDLRAAQNLPHAYLGLGTAGFPEAVQIQQEIQHWLALKLNGDKTNEN